MKRTGPDSIDSWIAAFWGCFIGMILFGMVRLSGMLFVASMEEFNVDREKASFPYILCDVTQAVIGPLTGYFACKYGTRPVLIFGSLLSAVGIGANFLAETIGSVTILWGIVFGAGFGFCCPVFPIIITQHFLKKRATAIGIMYIGSYLGISILPSIIEYLINNYGLHGTFLWLSGMVLHCIPVSMLLRNPNNPIQNDLNENRVTRINQISGKLYATERYVARKLSIFEGENDLNNRRRSNISIIDPNNDGISKDLDFKTVKSLKTIHELPDPIKFAKLSGSPIMEANNICKCQTELCIDDPFPITSCEIKSKSLIPQSRRVSFHNFPDNGCHLERKDSQVISYISRRLSLHKIKPSSAFKVFFEPIFILVLLSTAVYTCSFIAFMTIIVDFTRDIGLEVTDGKYIILGFSIASNVGLVSFGWLTDYGYMSLTNFSGLIFLLRGITTTVMTLSTGFPMLLTVVMIQGLCEASNFNVLPLIIAEYYSEDVHEVAISCSFVLSGPLHLAIPYLISFFRDGMGSYNYLFYSMSAASLLCSVLLFLAPLMAKCRCVRDDRILRNRDISVQSVMA